MSLREETIRVAFRKPHLRPHLLPLLRQAAPLQKEDVEVEEGKMHEILGLDKDQNISEFGSPRAATQRIIAEMGEQKAASMINWAANITNDAFLKEMQEQLKRI